MHGGIYQYSDNINTTHTWTLDEIPRYANITSLSVKSRTVNSITFSFTADKSCQIFARITAPFETNWLANGGTFSDGKTSGEFTIYYSNRESTSRLEPNKTYTFGILCRSKISGLDTAKSITATTYDIAKLTEVPNVNIGSAHTIKWNNPSGATIALKLCKTDNSQIINYGTVTGTSKSITPTAGTIYGLTPNSNTYKARYIITTTVNSTSYTNYKDFTFTVTNSNPTFSNFSYEDINTKITELTGSNQILVKGYSNVKITISTANKATAKNSATMKNYRAIIGNQSKEANYNSNTNVTMQINRATSGTIAVNAIDSRGNSTQALKVAEMKDYSKPTITKMQLVRSNNGVGENVTLNFEGTWWNKSFGAVQNAISKIEYWYKKTNSSSNFVKGTKAITFSIYGNKFSGSLIIEGDTTDKGFDASSSYYIYMNVTDKLDISNNHQVTLSSGTPAVAIYKDSVAIGQKYDTDKSGKLQINGHTYIHKKEGEGDTYYVAERTDTGAKIGFGIGAGGTNHGIWSYKLNSWLLHADNTIGSLDTDFLVQKELIKHSGYYPAYRGQCTDFNTAITHGYYGVFTTASNAPYTGNIWGYLQVIVSTGTTWNKSSNWIWQRFEDTSGREYTRYAVNNGSFTAWKKTFRLSNTTDYNFSCKTLYDNSSGLNGTITLNETAANFSYLEIYLKNSDDNIHFVQKVNSPNGKKVAISTSNYNTSQSAFYLGSKVYNVSGTSMTVAIKGYISKLTSSVSNSQYDNLNIVKVIGYR